MHQHLFSIHHKARALLLGLLLVGLALSSSSVAFGADSPALAPQTQGEVTFINGGVGESEVGEIKGMAHAYPLEVLFTHSNGAYNWADSLKIRDKAGKVVLDTELNGPYVLVQLPPGRYSVIARYGDVERQKAVNVAAQKHARVSFTLAGSE